MRASTTTRELSAFLSRPAFRALESIARHLGVRLPETSGQASSESETVERPAPGQSVSGPGEATATASSPAIASTEASSAVPRTVHGEAPRSSSELPATRAETHGVTPPMVRGEAGTNVSIAPPPRTHAEVRSGAPAHLESPERPGGATPPASDTRPHGRRIVRLLSPSRAPVSGRPPADVSTSAAPLAPTPHQTEAPVAAPVSSPSPVAPQEKASSGAAPEPVRAGHHGTEPLAARARGPNPHDRTEAGSAGVRTPVAPPPPSGELRSSTPAAPSQPPEPQAGVPSDSGVRAPGRRIVRLLPRSEPRAEAPSAEPRRAEVPSPEGPPPRPERRLTFLPGPESPATPAPARAPLPATAGIAERVTTGMTPVLEQAHQLTQAPSAAAPSGEAVRNTFNVNVHLDPSNGPSGVDRRVLEDALVDILRDTARRHGLEV